jgi:DNA-binding PadR family transcriptional regulator
MLEYILLGFLKRCELSGYGLKQCMARTTAHFFDASFGSIYPALKRMEERGAITVRDVVEGGKLKKLYAITEAGSKEFIDWLAQPIECSKTRPDPLVKLFFYGFLPKDKAMENLEKYIVDTQKILKGLQAYEPEVKRISDAYQYSTLVYGLGQYEFIIQFCKDLIEKIEGGKK